MSTHPHSRSYYNSQFFREDSAQGLAICLLTLSRYVCTEIGELTNIFLFLPVFHKDYETFAYGAYVYSGVCVGGGGGGRLRGGGAGEGGTYNVRKRLDVFFPQSSHPFVYFAIIQRSSASHEAVYRYRAGPSLVNASALHGKYKI